MTWDNNGWRALMGAEALRLVGAHEMGHIFGAEDEYSGSNSSCADESGGFPNTNHEDCPGGARTSCLMRQNAICGYMRPYPLCYWTRGQVGWSPECPPSGVCGTLGPWQCAEVRQCVDEYLRCDGARDCDDASDELACGVCAEDEYQCEPGECVDSFEICECADADRDGYRDASCGGDDCEDFIPSVNPEGIEECNGLDDDCDGTVDEPFDFDGDGYATCGDVPDCNDGNQTIHPGATDLCGDGVDQDCSGSDLPCDCPDADGDGHADHTCGGIDCDDSDPTIGGTWPDCGGPTCDGGPCPDGGGDDSPPAGCGCRGAGAGARGFSGALLSLFALSA